MSTVRKPNAELYARIDDYVQGSGPEAFEEEMFEAALEGKMPELGDYQLLVASIREVAERGTMENFILKADAEKMIARWGPRLTYHELANAKELRVVIPADAEIYLSKIPVANMASAERIDIEIDVAGVGVIKTMPDVAFDPSETGIYACCEGDLARLAANLDVTTRVWGHDRAGNKHLLHEFHTNTLLENEP